MLTNGAVMFFPPVRLTFIWRNWTHSVASAEGTDEEAEDRQTDRQLLMDWPRISHRRSASKDGSNRVDPLIAPG